LKNLWSSFLDGRGGIPQDETNSNADEHDEIIPEKICL
jgi:hypothetical protein